MSSNRKSRGFTGIGASTLLIVFVVLAITVFLLFTFFTVRQDLASSTKSIDAHKAYYAADVIVTEKLAELENAANNDATSDIESFAAELGFSLKSAGRGEYVFILTETIDKNSSISCTAVLKGGQLSVTAYETINKNSFVNEESLPIWDGETIPLS